MGLLADARALVVQKSAALTVRYGESLRFAGNDLADPEVVWVPTRHGSVRCLVQRPRDDDGTAPAYLHFHGGAFVMRHPEMDDFFTRYVASECGAVVVSVDYDVAPQARFPVAQHQAHDVLAWVAAHGDVLRAESARPAVGGFSAGGNLAASAVLQARDSGAFEASYQLLGVPSLDVAEDVATKVATAPHGMVSASLLRLVRATYFRDPDTRGDGLASPLLAHDLAGVPPALVITAERDVLRREGDRYAVRLRAAGVPVEHVTVPGVDHYFLHGPQQQARDLMELMANGLRRALGAQRPSQDVIRGEP